MRRSRLIAVALAAALAVPLIGAAAPAGATPAPGNGCNATATAGAVLAWYPGQPGSQSQLEAACIFTNNTGVGNNHTSAAYTIHDQRFAVYHNGSSRHITVNPEAVATNTLTAPGWVTGRGMALWANRTISGPGIPAYTHVVSVNDGAGTLLLNRAVTTPGGDMIVETLPAARSQDDATAFNPTTIVSADATFAASDVGHSISGTGIPTNTTITAYPGAGGANSVTISAASTFVGPDSVTIGGALNYQASGAGYGPAGLTITSTRQVTGVSVSAAATLTSAIGFFQDTDIGLQVTAADPDGTDTPTLTGAANGCDDGFGWTTQYITAVAAGPPSTATVFPGGMTPGRTCDLVIGEPNANAPAAGSPVANQGVQLNLNPTLVAGSPDCADDNPDGFVVVGKWYSPGDFHGVQTALPNRQAGFGTAAGPSGWPTSKAVAQLYVETSAATYSMYVMEREASTPAPVGVTGSYPAGTDPIGARHYDITVPFAPVGLALCPASTTSPGLGFSLNIAATAANIVTIPPGTGRPGTGQLRNIISRPAPGSYAGTMYATADGAGNQWIPTANFTRLCNYNHALPYITDFKCGAA